MHIILGSQSPRRKEILSFFSIPFEQVSSSFVEESIPFEGDPLSYVAALARAKAKALHTLYPSSLLITADTIVYHKGKVYGKPRHEEEAFQALSSLSGQWHSVFTGVAVSKGAVEYCDVEETKVLFNSLTKEQIRHYQQTLHCSDKAGGYAIQLSGSLIVRKIEGCFYNVMGLPINTLYNLLLPFGIDLWKHI